MSRKLSGKDIDVMIGSMLVHVEKYTVSIEDATGPAFTRGVPDGWISGDKKASGEIEVDTNNLMTILDAAKSAGSFSALEPFDIVSSAATNNLEFKVEAFGCKLRISDLLDAAGSGGEKLKHKLPYDVTSRDFVRINGVPYIDASETENFI
ncbi:phage protein [uncultured Microbulbifer sp.]|uniref:phage protein n=1 Tax=uncultured Microbulbifer sp. TaxID=348147 RepID=UPI002630F13F|nr:phage protein [uncultured Microbulbifer sp.]